MTHLVTFIFISLGILGHATALPLTTNVFEDALHGLSLRLTDNWSFFTSEHGDHNGILIIAHGTAKDPSQSLPTLTLRSDKSKLTNAKTYGEHWLREYPKFGFEIEFGRSNTFKAVRGYEMELKSLDTGKLIHQFILPHNKEMLVFTCSDTAQRFQQTLEACRKIVASLQFKN